MDLDLNLVTACAFLVIFVGFVVIGQLVIRLRNDPVRQRLQSLAKGESMPGAGGLLEGLSQQLPQTSNDNGALDRELRRAGYYKARARVDFLALRNGLVIFALFVTGAGAIFVGPDNLDLTFKIIVGGAVAASLCWAIPRVMLTWQGNRRVRRITGSLPYALDMITMSLTGGLSLREALFHVSKEIYASHPEVAVELLIIRQQAELLSLDMAFDQFARRIDSHDVVALAALIAQGQQLGNDVATSINQYADSMREKRRQSADAKSSRAAVIMLLPMTFLMLPAALILLWGPSILELVRFLQTFDGAGTFLPP